jgi:hypothetical protein
MHTYPCPQPICACETTRVGFDTICNTPLTPGLAVVTLDSSLGPTLVFSVHFCPDLCAPGKTSQSVTHPEIAPGHACLTSEFYAVRLSEKKVYLGGMSIQSILLSLEPGCHNILAFLGEDAGL